MKKVLIIYGSKSYEHDVSIISYNTIKENIDYKKYDVSFCYIDKQNEWFTNNKKIMDIISFLKQFDVVFSVIHGAYGEDGKLAGLFEAFNIKYIGPKLESSVLSYDKEITKIILEKYNIPQIPYYVIHKDDNIDCKFEYPVIIKPARCGSSIGINVANNKKEYKKYIKIAFMYDDKVIVEKFKKVRDLEYSYFGDNKISEIGEIKSSNVFYDYEAKYQKESKLIIPAEINNDINKKIRDYSYKICKILGINEFARLDYLLDDNNNLYFNEINTIPGFTDKSMFFKLLLKKYKNIKNIISIIIDNA